MYLFNFLSHPCDSLSILDNKGVIVIFNQYYDDLKGILGNKDKYNREIICFKVGTPMDKGKSWFVRLPRIENLSIEPTTPYDLPTSGYLHIDKFSNMLSELLDKTSDIEKYRPVFAGHLLEDEILSLSINQLADFTRHILVLNSEPLNIDYVDDNMFKLNRIYQVPSWEIPNFVTFNNSFTELNTIIIIPEFSRRSKNTFNGVIAELKEFSLLKDDYIISDNAANQDLIKIMDVIEVLNYLNDDIYLYKTKLNTDNIRSLKLVLLKILDKEIYSTKYQFHIRFMITIFYLQNKIMQSTQSLLESLDIIDSLIHEIYSLQKSEYAVATILLGSIYGQFANEFFSVNIDLIYRRKLLSKIIASFVTIESHYLEGLFDLMLKQSIDDTLLQFVLKGYFAIYNIIRIHSKEIPPSNTQKFLIDTAEKLFLLLESITYDYLSSKIGFDFSSLFSSNQTVTLEQKKKLLKQHITVIKYLTDILKIRLVYKPFKEEHMNKAGFDLVCWLLSEIYSPPIVKFFKLQYELRFNKYPFKEISEKIIKDTEIDNILVNSETFDQEVLQVASVLLKHLLHEDLSITLISKYETLILFIGEWLQHLKNEALFSEALLVISPIISIGYVQIAKLYFSFQQIPHAFIAYCNMIYFMEIVIELSSLSDVYKADEHKLKLSNVDIMNKFSSMVTEWDFLSLISETNMKKSVSEIELTLSIDSRNETIQSLEGMLEDEILFDFMDISQEFESFFSMGINNEEGSSISKLIIESELYSRPGTNRSNKLCGLGYVTSQTNPPEIPFPLICNISLYATAIAFFPISLPFVSIVDHLKKSEAFVNLSNIF